MSYNTDLQSNNAELEEILAMVNALPDAGSGEVEITLQEKSVTPTKSAQEVTADSGYDGLLKVNVGEIPDEYIVPSGTKNITANGTHDVTANASVSVNVPVPDGYIIPSGTKSITENGTHNIKEYENVSVNVPVPDGYIVPSGTKSITSNGEHDVTSFAKASVNVPIPDGYVKPSGTLNITENGTYDVTEKESVAVSVDTEPTLQSKTVTPTASDQNVTADSGYDGLSAVTVKGDANLVAGNIKSGVSIFGVSGNFEGSGSGGASEMQIASGTFTSSSADICSNPISITGIGFTPKQVFITLGDHAGGSKGMSSSSNRTLVAIFVGEIYNRELYGVYSSISLGSKALGTNYSATILQDGFTITAHSTKATILNATEYKYVAIG